MSWAYPLVPIGELVSSVRKWNPCESVTNKLFTYIDIASINRETKQVEEAVEILTHEAPSRARQIVNAGDILVSTVRPNLNAVAHLDSQFDSATASTGFTVLRTKPQKLDSRYLYYWVRTSYFIEDMVRRSTGASYPAVSDSIIKEYGIPFPPLEEQRRIAAILNKANAVCRKRQQAIALTEELLRSAFLEMFGDPITNPKGWNVQLLGKLCTIRRGASPRPIDAYLGGSVPWSKIGDATESDDIYINKTAEAVTPEGAKKSVYLELGSLIFANCGVSLGFARILGIGGCIHDGWLSFSDISESLNKIYLLKLLNSVTNHFRRIAPSGTQPNLNTSIMKEFNVPVPPIQLQLEFADIVTKISLEKQHQSEALSAAHNLFNFLLQRAFRGDI